MHRVTRSGLTESADGSMARVANVYCRCGRHVGLDKGSLLMEVRLFSILGNPHSPGPTPMSASGSDRPQRGEQTLGLWGSDRLTIGPAQSPRTHGDMMECDR